MNTSAASRFKWRKLLLPGVGALLILGIALGIYGFLIEPNRLVINRYEIRPANLNKSLAGLKIVVISDLHGGSSFMTVEKLKQVVATVNAQDPDVVVILGDFVSQVRRGDPVVREPLKMPMKTVAASIRGLKGKYGVFAVIGNHDFWYDQDAVKFELEAVGIDVLFDEVHELDVHGTPLSLLGLRDHANIHSYNRYLDEIKPVALKARGDVIVLTHSPDVVAYMTAGFASETRTRLVLAGHTHGGQVWIPGFGSPVVPSSYGQTFAFGHVNYKGLDVFVTSGIGTSIMPVRFMMPPEIAVLTLRSDR